jgi:hypothetical protein
MNTVATLCRRSTEDCLGAIDEIENAQAPESEGGENITPTEATRIRMRVLAAAALSNNAAEISVLE